MRAGAMTFLHKHDIPAEHEGSVSLHLRLAPSNRLIWVVVRGLGLTIIELLA
jgi:hypothetical protein